MIYGFGDTDKSKVPTNVKYSGNGVLKGIELDDSETTIPQIKKIIDLDFSRTPSSTGVQETQFETYPVGTFNPDKCLVILHAYSSATSTSYAVVCDAKIEDEYIYHESEPYQQALNCHYYTNAAGYIKFYGKLIEFY